MSNHPEIVSAFRRLAWWNPVESPRVSRFLQERVFPARPECLESRIAMNGGSLAFPASFVALGPDGSLVYSASHADAVAGGETDSFTLTLEAGQSLTLLVEPSDGLQPRVHLASAGISRMTDATAVGKAVLQTHPVASSGEYTFSISGLSGTAGAYTVRAYLNAGVEMEAAGGNNNNSLATAEPLSGHFLDLGNGASRTVVIGSLPGTEGDIVLSESFEGGVLPGSWTTYSSSSQGRIRISNIGGAVDGTSALLMDSSSFSYVLNEAIWTVDLTGVPKPGLSFAHLDTYDNPDTFSGSFTGHRNADGIAISADGVTWFPIWNVPNQQNGWQSYNVDLAAAAANAGITLGANLKIKFQQYGLNSVENEYGRGWDKIAITTPANSDDWYRVSVAEGESLSFLAESLAGPGLKLEVKNAAGVTLAQGVSGNANADQVIQDFVAPATGELYLKVSGTIGGDYSLMVARGTRFDVEPNRSAATAQELGTASNVLGAVDQHWLGRLFGYDAVGELIQELDPQTGSVLRSFALPFNLESTYADMGMATTRTTLLVGGPAGSAIYELDPDTGATLRTIAKPSTQVSGMAFLDGEIFLLSNSPANTITVLDYESGAVKRTITSSSPIQSRLAASETTLYGMYGALVYRIDPVSGITALVGTPANPSYYSGLGIIGNELFAADYSAIDVTTFSSLEAARSLDSASYFTAIGADGGTSDADFFRVRLDAGATLTLRTSTPPSGTGATANTLDPILDLYDPNGVLVASDDDGAADSRNALLSFVANSPGEYTVRVRAAVSTGGEYLLNVTGAPETEPAFQVSSVGPVDGNRFTAAPSTFRIDFNDALDLTSLQAADLTINGVPATAVSIIDGDTLEFTIADPGAGTHSVAIAAGAISDIQNTPVAAFSSTFTVDTVAPRVVSTSFQEGDVLPAGALTVVIGFSEPMKTTGVNGADLTLKGGIRGTSYTPANVAFDASGTQLTVTYPNLPEDRYTLTLLSRNGSFEDLVGRDLDGEPGASPLPPNQSGNGVDGGDFTLQFTTQAATGPLLPLNSVEPLGSGVYSGILTAAITSVEDVNTYTIELGAGARIAFFADADATLRPKLTLRGPNNEIVGTVSASAPGEDIVLPTVTTAQAGTYTLFVEGVSQTQGLAAIRTVLNAVTEPEALNGTTNNSLQAAVNLDDLLLPLAGGGSRVSIVGNIENVTAALPTEIEPNTTVALANVARANFAPAAGDLYHLNIRGTRSSSSDLDFFAIGSLEAGDVISIAQSGGDSWRGTLSDPRFTLYRGSTGEPVTVLSDDNDGPGWDALEYRYQISATDTYYIAASGGFSGNGTYDLSLWLENTGTAPQTGGTFDAEVEGNNTIATANNAATSWRKVQYLSRTSATSSAGDTDLYRFEFQAGDLVTVNLDSTSSVDLRAAILNSAGTEIARDDGFSNGPGNDSLIYAFRIPSSGTYYVRAGNVSGAGAYQADVYLSSSTPPPAPATAEDFYSLTLAAGERSSFAIDTVTGGTVKIEVQDGTGTVLAMGVPNESGGVSIEDFTPAEAGRYYIQVTGALGSSYNLVSLTGTEFESESNNSLETAQPLGPSMVVVGKAGSSEPSRVFAYDSVANLIREIEPQSGHVIRSFASPVQEVPSSGQLALATTGNSLLIAGSRMQSIYEVDLDTGATIRTFWSSSDITGLAFLDGKIYVTPSTFGTFSIRTIDYVSRVERPLALSGNPFSSSTALGVGDGVLFAIDSSDRLHEIDPTSGRVSILGILPGIGTAGGLGVSGNELFVADGSEIEVFDLTTLMSARTLTGFAGLTAIGADESNTRDADYFQVRATEGSVLKIRTTTPGSSDSQNAFDPFVVLYGASGQVLATDNNSAPDGRNAFLEYIVPATGIYTVYVRGFGAHGGDYVLAVEGGEAVEQPFAVTSTTPVSGSLLGAVPATIRVKFNEALLLSSLEAGDFLINGSPVTGFTVIDGDTVEFPVPAGVGQGTHAVSIAAGTLTSVAGVPLEGYSGTFGIDQEAPRVTAINIQKGDVLTPGPVTFTVTFSEPMKTSEIDTYDLQLVSTTGGATYTPALSFNATGDVLTITSPWLPEGNYQLTLLSGFFAFVDPAGRYLDGETSSWPIPGNQSGDGSEGGNFVLEFSIDLGAGRAFTSFSPSGPSGAQVYAGSERYGIFAAGDVDEFTIAAGAGQALTLIARPDGGLKPEVAILDANGNPVTSKTASLPGGEVLIHLPSTALGGSYTIRLAGAEGTTGAATLEAYLNAGWEMEGRDGSSNNSILTAENIDALFANLTNGTKIATLGGVIDRIGGPLPSEQEPNNSPGQANPAQATFTAAPDNLFQLLVRGTRDTTSDVDYFNIGALKAGDVLTISQTGLDSLRGTLGVPNLTLYRASTGTPVWVANDSYSGPGNDALIGRVILPADDTYYIAASGSGTGTYELALWLENKRTNPPTGGTALAETEGNDTAATANDISANWRPVQYLSRVAGAVSVSSDTDVYAYQFTAGDLVTIEVDPASSYSNLRLSLIDASGAPIAQAKEPGYGFGDSTALFGFQIPATGTYFLKVENSISSSFTAYAAQVYLSSATPPPAVQPTGDLFALSLAAGEQVAFAVKAVGDHSLGLVLQDASGNPVAVGKADDAHAGTVIQQFTAPADGTYYIRVTGDMGAAYQLATVKGVQWEADSNDSIDSAQDLGTAGTVLGHTGHSVVEHLFVYDSTTGEIKQLNRQTGATIRSLPSPIQYDGTNVGMATTGQTLLVSGGQQKLVYELDLNSGEVLRSITIPEDYTSGVAFMGDEVFVLTSSPRGQITVLDYETGAIKRTIVADGVIDGLAAADGVLLGTGSTTLYEIDPLTGSTAAKRTIGSYPYGFGIVGKELYVGGYSGIAVYHYPTFESLRTLPVSFDIAAMGADAGGSVRDDFFRINAAAGASLTLATATPGSALLNGLDPAIDLYDAAGTLIASNDNGAADGRNAALTLTVPEGGEYYVQVRAVGGTRGEYVLRVDGATQPVSTFDVVAVNPANGTWLGAAPASVRVDFNSLVDPASLQAEDLKIGGVPATAVRLIDGDSAEFTLPAGLPGGVHTLTLASGTVTDLKGVLLGEFSSQFEVDLTAPTIVGVSIQEGATTPSGKLVYVVEFSDPMMVANLDSQDFVIRRQQYPDSTYSASSYRFDATGRFLTLEWSNLPDDVYTLTLLSGDLRFQNQAGLPLDGELNGAVSSATPTGDGVPGGDFITTFTLDASSPSALTPKKQGTASSLLARASASTVLTPGDVDTYTVALNAGDSLAASVDSGANLIAGLTVRDAQGNVVAEIQGSAVDQTIQIPAFLAQADGVYSISISALADSSGEALLNVVRNGVFEAEYYQGAANDTLATAQDLSASFLQLGANARQVAVFGGTGGDDWYRFNLEAGETLAFAIDLAGSAATQPNALELTDASGAVLLLADTGFYLERMAHGFVAPSAGTYYLHVAAPSPGLYQLLAGVNIEFHDSSITSPGQSLEGPHLVLGSLRSSVGVFTHEGSSNRVSEISEGNGLSYRFIAPISGAVGSDLGLASTGSTLLSAARGMNSIREIDPATGSVLREIQNPGKAVTGLAYNDGEIFVLRDAHMGEIAVLDYDTGALKRTIFADVPLDENLASTSTHLIAMRGNTVYQIDPQTGLTSALGKVAAPLVPVTLGSVPGVEGLGIDNGKLYVGYSMSSSYFSRSMLYIYDLATLEPLGSTLVGSSFNVIEAISGDSQEPTPHLFTVQAFEAGSTLQISAATPGGDRNTLLPRLELLDAAGNVIASDIASDGHDVMLRYTAPVAGTFTVRISATAGEGEYVLGVLGSNESNDAPILDTAGTPSLPALVEGQSVIPGTRIADLLGLDTTSPAVIDLDAAAVFGVAITGADSVHGTWEYSLTGETWMPLGEVSESSARLLSADSFVRFVPATGFNGTARFHFRAWDQTSGTLGETADTTLNGGATAFSSGVELATVTVLAVDDAPEITTPGAQITREDAPLTFSSVGGNLIALVDPDGGSPEVHVTISTANGTLTLSTVAGLTFSAGDGAEDGSMTFSGDVAAINAALDGLVFTPTPEFAGNTEISVEVREPGQGTGEPPASSGIVPVKVTPVIEFTGSTTFTDANGDRVKVVLRGGGQGEIWLSDLGDSDAAAIVLNGTTAKSSLTIITPRGAETTVGDIVVNGSLKSLTAGSTDLTGTLSVTGSLRSAVLDDLTGSSISLHTDSAIALKKKSAVSLKFDRVSDTSLTSGGLHVSSLKASEWLNSNQESETISVPSLGQLNVTGHRKQSIAGDLGVDLAVEGKVKTIRVAGDVTGDIDAGAIGSVQVKGNLVGAQITLSELLHPVRPALGSLKIGGLMDNSVVESAGSIGAITLGGMRGSRIFAGVANDTTVLPDSTDDFAANASIRSISIAGALPEFSNSLLAASSIGRLSLKGVVPENGGISFGVAADRIAALLVKHSGGTSRYQKLTSPEQSLTDEDFLVRVI